MFRWLLFALLAASASSDWLNGDDGVDRAYGDLPDMPIGLNSSEQASDCAKLCLASNQCVAWVYSKPSCGGGSSQPQCYLKAKVMAQSYNPCRVRFRVEL